MKRFLAVVAGFLIAYPAFAATSVDTGTKRATVMIANYADDANRTFLGWGSGFFVDEGIVVTNKHVIQGGDWYRVYPTGEDFAVDKTCSKNITKSDVKINLDDDVAYMRVFLPCEHSVVKFAQDPIGGDPSWIVGYPFRNSYEESLTLVATTGNVTGTSELGWLKTSAHLDFGNSGGPVANESGVIGVAVAKGVDEDGNFVTGYFIPSSVIEEGLLYANDSRFGYTPQSSRAALSRSSSSSTSRQSISSSRKSSSSPRSVSSNRSSRSSSRSIGFSDVTGAHIGYEAIIMLQKDGILSGYSDGTFRPDAGVNRAELLKILVAGFRPEEIFGQSGCFSDVANEWYSPYVCAAKELGWVDGYPDGTFRPAQSINRAEAMKIVVNAFDSGRLVADEYPRDVPPDAWFRPFVAVGVGIGIVDPDFPFRPERELTREDAARWIYGARK